jgi:hypothetical protein
MKEQRISGTWQQGNKQVDIRLQVWVFEEEGYTHVFSPHLNIVGAGVNEDDAFNSFRQTLSIFLDYTTNKGTFFSELKKLGWEIKKKSKPYKAPEFGHLLQSNETLKHLVDRGDYRVSHETVNVPVYA